MPIILDVHIFVKSGHVDEFKAAVAKIFKALSEKQPHSLSHRLEGYYEVPKLENDPANLSSGKPLECV